MLYNKLLSTRSFQLIPSIPPCLVRKASQMPLYEEALYAFSQHRCSPEALLPRQTAGTLPARPPSPPVPLHRSRQVLRARRPGTLTPPPPSSPPRPSPAPTCPSSPSRQSASPSPP